jgi:hypothetical protein
VHPTLDTTALVFTTLVDSSIADDAVDNAKLANMDSLTIKGAISSGNPDDLTPDEVIAIINSGGTSQFDAARVNLSGVTFIDPTLSGTTSAPTASSGDSSTKIATTQFVSNAISAIPSTSFGLILALG